MSIEWTSKVNVLILYGEVGLQPPCFYTHFMSRGYTEGNLVVFVWLQVVIRLKLVTQVTAVEDAKWWVLFAGWLSCDAMGIQDREQSLSAEGSEIILQRNGHFTRDRSLGFGTTEIVIWGIGGSENTMSSDRGMK